MARRRQPPGRKRRTREHVIANLSANSLERKVLECGYCFQRTWHDYGIDGEVLTFDERGEVESGFLLFQLKATDSLKTVEAGTHIPQRVLTADLKTWLFDLNPVILVVYDATADRAHWLDVQDHVREYKLSHTGLRSTTLHVPTHQLLTAAVIRVLRERKMRALADKAEREED